MNMRSKVSLTCLCGGVLVLLLTGMKTTDIQGPRAFSAVSVSTSADGQTVYLADLKALWKSLCTASL